MEVLAEIPRQLVEYYKFKNLDPEKLNNLRKRKNVNIKSSNNINNNNFNDINNNINSINNIHFNDNFDINNKIINNNLKSNNGNFNNCNGKARYDIYYDDLYILHVIINQDNYSGDLENTEVSSISGGFYNKDIDPAETDISFFSTLSLESDYNDIISYLGTPDTIFDYNMKYNFSYNGTSYFIEFNYDSLDFSTSPAKLLGIYIVTKRS